MVDPRSETANTITHGIGIVLSVVGLIFLLVTAAGRGTAANVVSSLIYGLALILVYTSSTLHHGFSNPRIKNFFLRADHSCIYLLIAGTYTPFMIRMGGFEGAAVLAGVWGLSGAGIFYKIKAAVYRETLSKIGYVGMGWLVILVKDRFLSTADPMAVKLLVLGGLTYCAGLIFFHLHAKYSHAIWHLFVLVAGGLHYASVFYTLP